MYQTKRTFARHDIKLYDLIIENPNILLMLEYFGLETIVGDYTIEEFCKKNNVKTELITTITNLYNGFHNIDIGIFEIGDIELIVKFLKNSHTYYLREKYPEIQEIIRKIENKEKSKEIQLISQFFNEYFNEVAEHLEYEDKIVFPYITHLLKKTHQNTYSFSVQEYQDHHTDIEFKLTELCNLLLKHVKTENADYLKPKLLNSILELEQDLYVHSMIEDKILIPLVHKLEDENKFD